MDCLSVIKQINTAMSFTEDEKGDKIQIQKIIPQKAKNKYDLTPTQSEKIAQYCQFFNIPRSSQSSIRALQQRQQNNREFIDNIRVQIISQTTNKEFVIVKAQVGIIETIISIAHFDHQSPLHECSKVKLGGFGHIYFCESLGNKIAVKCTKKVFNKQNIAQNMDEVLKQYAHQSILNNFYTAPVSPKLYDGFGYNIAIYTDCIEFAMEVCIQPQDLLQNKQKLVRDLKQSLMFMHHQKIIHLDIKPENVMFSPIYKRFVFCDLGFCKIIQESFGYKTMTSFKGTLGNCSHQMRELYLVQNSKGLIDLYYNDFHCLKNTLELMISNQSENPIKQENMYYQQQVMFNLTDHHLLSTLKFYFFDQDYDELYNLVHRYQLNIQQLVQLFRFSQQFLYKIQNNAFFQRNFPQDYSYLVAQKKNESLLSQTNNIMLAQKPFMKNIFHINKDSSILPVEMLQNDHQSILQSLPIYTQQGLANKQAYLYLISTLLNLSQKQLSISIISQIAKDAKRQFSISLKINQFVQECAVQIAEVSLFLFKESLDRRLSGIYLNVFINIVHNIGFLHLIQSEQLKQTLKIIFSIEYISIEIMKGLLAFFSLYKIMQFESQDILKWVHLEKSIQKIADQYAINVIQPLYQQNIYLCYAIKFILHQLTKKSNIRRIDFEKYLTVFGIDFLIAYYCSLLYQQIQPNLSLIKGLASNRQLQYKSKFQYFHLFIVMYQYCWNSESPIMKDLLNRYSEVKLINKPNHWKMISDLIVSFEAHNGNQQSALQIIDYFCNYKDAFPYSFNIAMKILDNILKRMDRIKGGRIIIKKQKIINKMNQWNKILLEVSIINNSSIQSPKYYRSYLRIINQFTQRIILYKTIQFRNDEISQFRVLYKETYQQLAIENDKENKLKNYIRLNIQLIYMLTSTKKYKIALQLLRKLFMLIKAANIPSIIDLMQDYLVDIQHLEESLDQILQERLILVKDIYLYYYHHQSTYSLFSNPQNIVVLFKIIERYHPHYLLTFIKRIFSCIRAMKGQTLNLSIIGIFYKIYLQKYSCNFPQILYNTLRVQQNPSYILLLSFTYFLGRYGNFQQIYFEFYRTANIIPLKFRKFILFYINYFYLIKHISTMKKRKLKYLIRLNMLWGDFALLPINAYNRLVSRQSRARLNLEVFVKNKRTILQKLDRLLEMLSIIEFIEQYFINLFGKN